MCLIMINICLFYDFVGVVLHLFLNIKLFFFFIEVVHRIIFNILLCNIHFVIKGNFLLFVAFLLFNFDVLWIFPISPFIWILENVMAFLKHLVKVLHSQRFRHINNILIINLILILWQVNVCFLFSLFHYFLDLLVLVYLPFFIF